MGKQKRARQKFHLASVRWKNEEKAKLVEGEQVVAGDGVETGESLPTGTDLTKWEGFANMDNIFKGINIDVSQLKTKLVDDDAVSVKSIAKSLKSLNSTTGKHMKKIEKRKLRHNLFIQKIDSIYQDMKKKKGYKKLKNASLSEESKSDTDVLKLGESEDNKSDIDLIKKKTSGGSLNVKQKLKGIQKTKKRKMQMLRDINAFKQLISQTTLSSSPINSITSKVEEKVFDELL